jgi:predicted TPR repeat methyltransferase
MMVQVKSQATDSFYKEETLDDLEGYIASAVVIAALEHGLFWLLQSKPMQAEDVSEQLDLPLGRCRYWLQYLCRMGYLFQDSGGYTVTEKTVKGILESYSQESWSLLAQEAREASPPFLFFSTHLTSRDSLWRETGLDPQNYIENMIGDPTRARRFTRMLYELHQDLAHEIAQQLDLTSVQRMMDLGGGSGVVSAAILQRHPTLTSLVVDINTVCAAGEELAEEVGLSERLRFHPADFMQDELPSDYDLVLECDVGVYNEELFVKIREALPPGGRYVIIDQFAPAPGIAPEARLSWALQGSLRDPEFQYRSADEIANMLDSCGFSSITIQSLSVQGSSKSRFSQAMYIIQAMAPE